MGWLSEALDGAAWKIRLTRKTNETPYAMAFLWNERTPQGYVKTYAENYDMTLEAWMLDLVKDRDAVDLLIEDQDQYEVPLLINLQERLTEANFASFNFLGPY